MKIAWRNVAGMAGICTAFGVVLVACGGGAQPTATPPPKPTVTATSPSPTSAVVQPTATPRPIPSAPAPTAAGPQPKNGGTLKVRWFADTPLWDTYHTSWFYTTAVAQQFMNNLMRFRRDSLTVLQPELAERWEASADGKTYTFSLRKDAKWHDGTPFASADVAYNLLRAADPKTSFNKDAVAPVKEVQTPDASTVRVVLNRVSAAFVPRIAGPYMLMYPAKYPDMAAWSKAPVGTGAFQFKARDSATYEFVRNPSYYAKDSAGRSLPYLDGVTYFYIPDKALGLASLRSGRLDCACVYDSDFLDGATDQVQKDIPGFKLLQYLGPRLDLKLNMKRAPLDNLGFRQAVAIGLDKGKVVETVLDGRSYWPTPSLIPPELGGKWGLPKEELVKIPGFNLNHSVDLALARKKIQESGLDPRSFTADVLGSAFYSQVDEVVATLLTADLGLKTAAAILSTAEANQRRNAGNFFIWQDSPSEVLDDPGDRLVTFMRSDGAQNYTGYQNARIDQLLTDQDAEVDPAKRRTLLWEVQRIQFTEWPAIPLLQTRQFRGTYPYVNGYLPGLVNTSSAFRLEEVWLEK